METPSQEEGEGVEVVPVVQVVVKGVDQELRLLSRVLDDLARGSPCQELDQTALHHQPEQSGKTKQGSFDTQEEQDGKVQRGGDEGT